MIPIDLTEAHKAFHDKKINMWEMTFLEGVHKEDDLTEKQYDKILVIAERMLPLKLLIVKEKTYGSVIDPYFNQRYYPDEY